jgi:hypothetical protein
VIIACELFIFVLILTLILFLGSQARSLQDIDNQKEAFRHDLSEKRELFFYDHKLLTGDDIVVAAKKYNKLYDMKIQLGEVGGSSWYNNPTGVLTKDSSDLLWGEDNIRSALAKNITKHYRSSLEKDYYGNITSIVFTRAD